MITEKHVDIAKKMYDSRRCALFLLGPEKFKAKVEGYRPIIQDLMDKWKCDEIKATMKIVEMLISKGQDDGMAVMLAFAACVEMVEPTQGI